MGTRAYDVNPFSVVVVIVVVVLMAIVSIYKTHLLVVVDLNTSVYQCTHHFITDPAVKHESKLRMVAHIKVTRNCWYFRYFYHNDVMIIIYDTFLA